jgi:hypothetical protein
MGASPSRLIRQLLTESVVLATARSTLGLLHTLWTDNSCCIITLSTQKGTQGSTIWVLTHSYLAFTRSGDRSRTSLRPHAGDSFDSVREPAPRNAHYPSCSKSRLHSLC